jgi:hypothetical protein
MKTAFEFIQYDFRIFLNIFKYMTVCNNASRKDLQQMFYLIEFDHELSLWLYSYFIPTKNVFIHFSAFFTNKSHKRHILCLESFKGK